MSKILLPFVYHNSISHKYYFVKKHKPINLSDKEFSSLLFSSGIRQSKEDDYDYAYVFLLDMIILYDECFISFEDLVYLYAKIGKENTNSLLRSGAIKIYESFSSKIAVFSLNNTYHIYTDQQGLKNKKINDRINLILKSFPENHNFKVWYVKSIKRHLEGSYYINEFDNLLYNSKINSIRDFFKPEVVKIIEESKTDESSNIAAEQLKLNRLLHFHYYVNLTKQINCDYLYVPEELRELFKYYSFDDIFKNDLNVLFDNIRYFEDIPDIPSLIKDNHLEVSDILKIRNSKEARNFRSWLSKVYKEDSNISDDEMKKIYFQACSNSSAFKKVFNSKKGVTLRTIGSISSSFINPFVGISWAFTDLLLSIGLDGFNPSKYTKEQLLKKINKIVSKV